jgi:uncharacterized protein
MNSPKQISGNIFASWTRFQFRYPKSILLLWVLVLVLLFVQLGKLKVDPSGDGIFDPHDPVRVAYDAFREMFGRDEMIMLAIDGSEIFEVDFLKKLQKLHVDLEENVPFAEEVNSLINARHTFGERDLLIVQDLMERFPETQAQLDNLKKTVLSSQLYRNQLISEDGKVTTILIKIDAFQPLEESNDDEETDAFQPLEESSDDEELTFTQPRLELLTDEQNSQLITSIKKIANKYNSEGFRIHLTGSPIVIDNLKSTMPANMGLFILLAFIFITLLLLLMLKRWSGMILPLVVVIFSLIGTFSMMGFFGAAIQMPTQILPSFLIAVGVSSSVHILVLFFVEMRKNHDKEEAMVKAMSHSAMPVIMTGVTTAAGLLSFSTASITPIAELGIFSAVGAILCVFITLTMMPALTALIPMKDKTGNMSKNRPDKLGSMMMSISRFTAKYPRAIVVSSIVILVIFASGIPDIRFSHSPVKEFAEDDPIRLATRWIDKQMKGSTTLDFLIDTGIENGFYQPEILNALERMKDYANAYQGENGEKIVGYTISMADMIKEINQALHGNKPEYYVVPQDRKLISQEFLLFENSGSDDLEDMIDSQFRTARFTIKVPWGDAAYYVRFVKEMNEELSRELGGEIKITATGFLYLMTSAIEKMMNSAAKSYLIAGCLITLLMILILRSFRLGLFSMFPNFFPIVLTLGFMGWADIPLDMITILIGSIAIGLVVDDTIHFMHNYQKYYQQTGSPQLAVQHTLDTTGRAMLMTTLILSIGFGVCVFSPMAPMSNFGILTALTLIMALLADLLIAPAIMILLDRIEIRHVLFGFLKGQRKV